MMRARKGFTLLEVMIASSIMVIAMAAVATFFTGIHRLVANAFCVAQASLDMRVEREHLLFHTYHEGGNAYWAGALSPWHKIEVTQGTVGGASGSLKFDVMGLDSGTMRVRNDKRSVTYPAADFVKMASPTIQEVLATGKTQKGSNLPILIPVRLSRTVKRGLYEYTAASRVVIPVFGAVQSWNLGEPENVFYDTVGVDE